MPYFHIPATRDNRAEAEARQLELLRGNVDLVMLARYMQIISPGFLGTVGAPLINVHHSFLPVFVGAGPYHKAKERGVKLVGATAHYVTEDLDEGPIIEQQDVVRVDHRNSTADLVRLGADVERAVLSRAAVAPRGARPVGRQHDDRLLLSASTAVFWDGSPRATDLGRGCAGDAVVCSAE